MTARQIPSPSLARALSGLVEALLVAATLLRQAPRLRLLLLGQTMGLTAMPLAIQLLSRAEAVPSRLRPLPPLGPTPTPSITTTVLTLLTSQETRWRRLL